MPRCFSGLVVGSVMVFDPEHVAVASVVFAGADDVVAAPPAGLSGEQAAEGQCVGQAAGVGGDELAFALISGST